MPQLNRVLSSICSWAPLLEVLIDPVQLTPWGSCKASLGQLTALKQLEVCIRPSEDGQLPHLANLSALKLTNSDEMGVCKIGAEQLPSLRQPGRAHVLLY